MAETVAEQEPVTATEASLFRRRPVAAVAGVLFWGWLVAQWGNEWLGGVVVPAGEPVVPEAVFAVPARVLGSVATAIESAGTGLGPVAVAFDLLAAPFAWLAGAFDVLAFGVQYFPALAQGAWLTVVLTVVGIALGFVIAVPLAAARVYGRASAAVSLAYTELIRGTPLLAQLFVLYYGFGLASFVRELPGVGQGIVPDQAVWVAVVGFTINSAAYQAEYLRGAIESVDPGQLLAARSMGLSRLDGVRYVVLPQALRFAIPGWTNELVYLVKYSSLAAFITVPELFDRARSIASSNFRYTALFSLAALVYLGLVLTASNVMSWVEDRTAIPGVGGDAER